MKIKSVFFSPCLKAILFSLFLVTQGFAQNTPKASLNLPKLNFRLKSGIDKVNFPTKDSAQVAKVATRIQKYITEKFDSVSQLKKDLHYTINSTQRADFICKLTLALGNYSFNTSYPNYANLHLQVINQVTKDTVSKFAISLEEINEIEETRFQSALSIFQEVIFTNLQSLVTATNQLLNPNNSHHYVNKGAVVLSQYFTTTDSKLQPLAEKVTHLVNNTLAEKQTKKVKKVWERQAKLIYKFNYFPNYRLPSPKLYSPNSKDCVITGKFYQKDVSIQPNTHLISELFYSI